MPAKVNRSPEPAEEPEQPVVVDETSPLEGPVAEPIEDEELDEDEEEDVDDPRRPLTLEDADPSTELWEGGPTVADAVRLKEEHGDIFVTTITYDKYVMWKTLKRGEYRDVITSLEELSESGQMSPAALNLYQEELITEICSVWPKMTSEDFEGDLAGLPSLLSQQILEASGFTAIDTRGL